MSNHAVQGGELRHVSASQIKTFASCERKWFLDKVKHLPQPQSPALATGTRLHSQLEDYWETGEAPENGSLQRLIAMPEFPTRGDHMLIEAPRDYNMNMRLADVPVKGRLDMLDWSNLTSPHVWDLKSSSNFKWAHTPEALSYDVQLCLYARWTFNNFREARDVRVSHAYALTRGTSAKIVTSDPLTPGHVDSVIAGVEALVARMSVAAKFENQDDVPGNSRSCDNYGGCPYRGACTHYLAEHPDYVPDDYFDPSVTAPPQPGEVHVSLKERLAAKSATPGINPPDASKPPSVTPYVPASVTATPVVASEVSTSATSTSPLALPSFILYINAAPTRAVVMRLEDLIAAKSAPILAKHPGLVDVRQLKFGEGTTALVAAFLKDPPVGIVVATNAGLSGTVVDALIPLATDVVRGF